MKNEEYEAGCIGLETIPKVWSSKHSDICDFENYETVAKKRKVDQKTFEKKKGFIVGEYPERQFYDILMEYFKLKNDVNLEDCLIFMGQKFKEQLPDNPNKRHERDYVIVNLGSRYVLNVECKATLNRSEVAKGTSQLSKTIEIVRPLIMNKVSGSWRMVSLLYGQKIEDDVGICEKCRDLLLCPENVMENLMLFWKHRKILMIKLLKTSN